jgi:tetratricopeptide (TPR) repeat protein
VDQDSQDKKSPDQDPYKESPLMAKAYCAQALTVAQQPCFWESHYKNKADLKKKLAEWQDEVETITGKLEKLLEEKYQRTEPGAEKPGLWDRSDCRRLHKAIHETRGHFYLNCAIGPLNDSTLSTLPGFEQQVLLEKARWEFQQCALLLSPEVDTLTALGTACLFRHDYETARDYLKQATELNPGYELAVFRLAQTWEQENPHKAREILAEYRRKSTPPLDKDEVQERYNKLPLPITQPRRKLELWYPLGEVKT